MRLFRPVWSHRPLPLCASPVRAGFPSPADDYIEGRLDLNEHLIHHPASTFFVRAEGNSMLRAGIHHGDLLLVDRSLEPADGAVVVAAVDGELVVKRLRLRRGVPVLVPEGEGYSELVIGEDQRFQIWGVVTNVVHNLEGGHGPDRAR